MIKLKADFVITMNKNYDILQNAEVLFDEKIIDIGYNLPGESIYLGKNSVLMPALINTHTHLEFSSNKTDLMYGDFITWLESVINKKEELFVSCKGDCYKRAIEEMKKSGICAFGEISSSGGDLKYLKHSPLKVVYFNEIIGTNPAIADAMYQDFLNRLNESVHMQNKNFIPAVSIHSPYSVHPILMDKIIEIAKEKKLPIEAHFMESQAERRWLDRGEGEFKLFFDKHFKNAKPLIKPLEFIEKFKNTNTTFIHCVYANEEELQKISEIKASIAHCPVSNRLLNVGKLDLEKVKNNKIDYSVATDGLSSNYSLNLFKEIRAALLMHTDLHPKYLAKDLLKSVTINAAKQLNLNNGSIEKEKSADLIALKLPDDIDDIEKIPIQIILHTTEVEELYINGKKI